MPTYHVRYRLGFNDIHNTTPAAWRVDISIREDFGSVSGLYPLLGSGTPLVITRGTQSSDRFEPVLGSEVQIGVTLTDDLPDGAKPYFSAPPEPRDFFAIDETQFKVEIYKGDTLVWVGFCKPDYCEYQYVKKPYNFTITATDRIALLKSQLVDLDGAKTGTGFMSILSLLQANGLYKTGLTESLKVISSMKYDLTGDMFSDKNVRFELMVGDRGDVMSAYDSLVQIAASFGCRIFFENNSFWFQRIEDLITETPTVLTYGTTETPTSDTLAIQQLIGDVDSDSDPIFISIPAIQIGAAYKQVQIDLDYKFRGWLQNFNWYYWDGADFTNWSRSSTGFEIDRHGSGTDEDPYTAFLPKVDGQTYWIDQYVDGVKEGETFELSFKAHLLNTTRIAYQVHLYYKDDSDTYNWAQYYTGGTFWPVGVGPSPGSPVYHQYVNRPGNNDQDISIDLTLPAFGHFNVDAIPNAMRIMLIDPDGTFSDGGTDTGVEISEIKFSVISNGYVGETDTARVKKDYSTLNTIDNNAYIDGQDTGANSVYDGTAVTNTRWKTSFLPLPTTLQYVNLFSRLNVCQRPYKIMQCSLYSNTLSFEKVLKENFGDGSVYIQMYDEYDVRMCSHKVQLAEINHEDLDFNNVIDSWNTQYRKG